MDRIKNNQVAPMGLTLTVIHDYKQVATMWL